MNPTPFPNPPAAPANSRKRKDVLVALALAGGGAVFGAALAKFGVKFSQLVGGPGLREQFEFNVWTLLMLPLMWLVVVLAHEFGHLIGGRIGGMRPLMLFAGPLHFEFGADGRTRLKRSRVLQSFGGLAVCAPMPGVGRGAFALLVAGGPVASFVFAAVLLLPAFAIGGWLGGVLFGTAAISALIGVLTLIPLRAGGFMSDGGQLLGLARDDGETRQRLALSALMAQSYVGVRPRDWDPGLVAAASAECSEPTLQMVGSLLQAGLAEDRGQLDDADAIWRGLAERLAREDTGAVAPAMRGALALGVATWLAHRRRDAAAARDWLDAAKGGFNDPALQAFAEAATAWAAGDANTARDKLADARRLLPLLADRGGAVVLADCIDELARDLDARLDPGLSAAA